jgi:hypothetical protein
VSEPLTDEEQYEFFALLRRICENHVDQFVNLKLDTDFGRWYVQIMMMPAPGAEPEVYMLVPDALLATQPGQSGAPD